MKICIVSPTLNHGGAERVACLWAKGFAECGHEVYFVANIEEEEVYTLKRDIRLLPLTNPKGNKLVRYFGAICRLRKYYKTYHPDIIIGVMYVCSLLAKLAELGLKIPVVNTEHNSFERPERQPMPFVDSSSKFYLNNIYDAITVLTDADLRIIKNRFKRVLVLPNPTFLTPLADVPAKEKTVLAAGRIDAWRVKGFDVLIRAWGIVKRQLTIDNGQLTASYDNWRLQIAGTGSEKSLAYLKLLCKENGVEDSVDFLGFRTEIEELYQKSAVFVLSSRFEGFGMVLVEAMSQGCACVACDYMGRQREIFEELKDGRMEELKNGSYEECKNGILCPPDDVEALANALGKMIKDDEYRHSVQENAIKRSHSFTLDKITDRWFDIFEQLVH